MEKKKHFTQKQKLDILESIGARGQTLTIYFLYFSE
jgi:hypothetical protein